MCNQELFPVAASKQGTAVPQKRSVMICLYEGKYTRFECISGAFGRSK